MGRSYWQKMTSYRGSRKWKLCQHKVGADFRMFEAGNKDGLVLTEDDMMVDISLNDAWGVKCQRADGTRVIDGEGKVEYSEPSKDIVAIDDEDWKANITEAKGHKLKNASGSRDAFPEISLSNFKPVEGESVLSGIPFPASNQGPRPGVIFVF